MEEIQTQTVTAGLGSVEPGKVRGPVIKTIIAIVILGIIGSGVALATRVWDPAWSPFRPNPENVIEEMFSKMQELEAFHSDVEIDMMGVSSGNNLSVSLSFNGDVDNVNDKSLGNFELIITGSEVDKNLSVKAETIVVDKNSYYKLNDISLPTSIEPLLMMFGLDMDKIKGQWIRMEEVEAAELSEQEEAMQKKILALVAKSEIYYIEEELPDETINGKKVYHYVLTLKNEEVKKLFTEAMEASVGETSTTAMLMTEPMSESIQETFDAIGEISADIWIGKKDSLLYKARLDNKIDLSKLDPTTKDTMDIQVDVSFSDFNKAINVVAPENFLNIEELFSPNPLIFDMPPVPGDYPMMFPEM